MVEKHESSQNSPLCIALLDTAPKGQKGSMAQYGDMVINALSQSGLDECVRVSRIYLALPNNIVACLPTRIRNWIHHLWIMLTVKIHLWRCKADVIHILDGSHAYIAKRLSNKPIIATSHDVIPALQSKDYLGNSRPGFTGQWLIRKSLEGIKSVKTVIAVSNNTAQDLCRITDIERGRMHVVYSAISQSIISGASSNSIPSWHDRRSREDAYILHVGNNAFYKNRAGVLSIFSSVNAKCKIGLKMAGPRPIPELLKTVRELELAEDVEFVVEPNDDKISELYLNASLFLFPSLYEGFGWPPLEAMASGCPVVCSSAASLPEVVGDAALKCPVDDYDLMTKNCIAVLEDADLANELVQKGFAQARKFSLERMGRELMSVYVKARAEEPGG